MTWLLRSEVIGFIVVLFILLAWLLHQKNKRNNDLQKNKTIKNQRTHTIIVPKEKKERRRRTKSRKSKEHVLESNVLCEYQLFYKPIQFPQLPPEVETGNIEYKLRLLPQTEERFQQLVTQMKFRICNGNGQAFYEIGVADNGDPIGISKDVFEKSLQTLHNMSNKLGASLQILKVRDGTLKNSLSAEVLVRKFGGNDVGNEIRVALCGDMDHGKSTLLGVLSSGELDNGRGNARMNIFRHKHELENGRTSDIGKEILGFDNTGNIVNYSAISSPTWSEIIENSVKVISFMDLAGHKKYFRTTITGMIGNFPDYAMLVIGAKSGSTSMTQEHYNLTIALDVPTIIVITKTDICSENTLNDTISNIKTILMAPGSLKKPVIIENEEDVLNAAKTLYSDSVVPIFCVSNVTGSNLDMLKLFLSLLNPIKDWKEEQKKDTLLYIDDTFSVPDVGTVISGTLLKGKISLEDKFLLGPTVNNEFIDVCIHSIHANRLPVSSANAGKSICLAFSNQIEREICRKGQVLISSTLNPKPVWEFEANICLISQVSTITEKYEAVIHCGCSQQTAILLDINNGQKELQSGIATKVRFRFKYHSEFLQVGDKIIIREGSSGGGGTATKIF